MAVDIRIMDQYDEGSPETIELPEYPRVGDEIEWLDSGRNVQVMRFTWMVGDDRPIVTVR